MHTASFALAAYVNDKQSDWDEKINSMLCAYRTSVHSSTKETPFYLVYGRQTRLPVDLALPSGTEENLPEEELLEQRCETFLRLNISREETAKNIKKAQKTQKRHYDKGISNTDIKIGDRSLLHNTRKTTRKGENILRTGLNPMLLKMFLRMELWKDLKMQ